MSYCLLAVSGDCANGGMSDYSDFIPIIEYEELIKLYLHNQLEIELESFTSEISEFSDRLGELYKIHHDLGNALIDCGVFHHKWHKRTKWVLMEMHEGKPIWCSGPCKQSIKS